MFVFLNGFSQNVLKGKIITDINPSGILIVNYSTKQTVNSISDGSFSIEAKNNDLLIFSSVSIEPKEIIVSSDFFDKNFIVHLKSKTKELEEVIVKSYTAKSLGIDYVSIAKAAQLEAEIKSGNGQANLFALVGLLFSPFKSKKPTKKELNDKYTKELLVYYDYKTLEKSYKIPQPNIPNFVNLAVNNLEIIAALKAKNKTLLDFLILEMAKEYLKK